MFKLFNNRKGIIRTIKKEDIPFLLNIKDKYHLNMYYPHMFDEYKDNYYNVGIDDSGIGGYYASFILFYGVTIMNDPNYIFFNDVYELNEYLLRVTKRKLSRFLIKDNNYKDYIYSLNDDSLINEYNDVKFIIEDVDKYYHHIKTIFEKDITSSIRLDLKNNHIDKLSLEKYLSLIKKIRSELMDYLDIDIYLIKSNKYKYINRSRMISYLISHHQSFHDDNSHYSLLTVIRDNINIIFNIFNYKYKGENVVSLDNQVYRCLDKLNYGNNIPDYLFGNKDSSGLWDYKSVLKRLGSTVKVYDCYPLLSNNMIPLAFNNINEIEVLSKTLIDMGYEDIDDLLHISNHRYPPIAILVEPNKKSFHKVSSVTIMACMVSSRRRKVLHINEFLNNIDKIIIHHDFVFHNLLLLRISK